MDTLTEMTDPNDVIVVKIDFNEATSSAARPFQIAADLINALEDIDATFAKTISSSIETTLIVEDLQKSSIKVFLRNILSHADDDALKTLDWKPIIGQYLVKAKYAAIRWLDEDSPKLNDLTEEVAKLVEDADEIHFLPSAPPPNKARLVQSLDKLQQVKSSFEQGEGLTITLGREEYHVNLEQKWKPSDVMDEVDGERDLVSTQEIILIVRKPDMLGGSQWQFRLGKQNLSAPIEDTAWLEEYHSRNISIMPGDALQVKLQTENKFSDAGELIDTKQAVIEVIDVIPSQTSQKGLF
ncbi:hypothetical protein KUW09_14405 [Mameliella alba]|nr:hypothetical protein [Antarctobacter heliothermus]MBY6145245.1 hypothetical protein [Mameliella alba]MCA0954993.1 hypothetical protein [Mameliella alba]